MNRAAPGKKTGRLLRLRRPSSRRASQRGNQLFSTEEVGSGRGRGGRLGAARWRPAPEQPPIGGEEGSSLHCPGVVCAGHVLSARRLWRSDVSSTLGMPSKSCAGEAATRVPGCRPSSGITAGGVERASRVLLAAGCRGGWSAREFLEQAGGRGSQPGGCAGWSQ